jgi:putative salt-induced outer membrane protein
MSSKTLLPALLAFFAAFLAASSAQAQIQVQPDGKLRVIVGLSATVVSGNTKSSSISLNGEAIQLTDNSKWTMLARGLYAENDTGVAAANLALGTQYDRDLTRDLFSFAKFDYLRDRPANIDRRFSAYGGLGRHLVRNDKHTWDAIVGLGYTDDRYVEAASVSGQTRSRYGRTEVLLSETSNHKFTPNTTFRQKLEAYPDLRNSGEYRLVVDTALSVAMTSTMSLTTGLVYRYSSDPGVGLKGSDATFLTGIAVRLN